jgi:cytochrome c5
MEVTIGHRRGHLFRHTAAKALQEAGHTVPEIVCLTCHSMQSNNAQALQKHYFDIWAPRTAATSQACLRMTETLRRLFGGSK